MIFDKKKLPEHFGHRGFYRPDKTRFFANKNQLQVPDSGDLAPEADRIIAAVCQHYSIEKAGLMHSVRGVSNEPRNVAIYLIRILRKENLLSLGARFGMRG